MDGALVATVADFAGRRLWLLWNQFGSFRYLLSPGAPHLFGAAKPHSRPSGH
jgi:hypothetical protein